MYGLDFFPLALAMRRLHETVSYAVRPVLREGIRQRVAASESTEARPYPATQNGIFSSAKW